MKIALSRSGDPKDFPVITDAETGKPIRSVSRLLIEFKGGALPRVEMELWEFGTTEVPVVELWRNENPADRKDASAIDQRAAFLIGTRFATDRIKEPGLTDAQAKEEVAAYFAEANRLYPEQPP